MAFTVRTHRHDSCWQSPRRAYGGVPSKSLGAIWWDLPPDSHPAQGWGDFLAEPQTPPARHPRYCAVSVGRHLDVPNLASARGSATPPHSIGRLGSAARTSAMEPSRS